MLRYGITKILDVPLDYAHAWLTDFRNEDPRIIDDPHPRHILRRSKTSFVWIQRYKAGAEERDGVRIVTLRPPDAWHNEAITDEKESTLDYRLAPLGKEKTRLTIRAKVSFKTTEQTKSDLEKHLGGIWDKYGAELEKDYRSGKGPLD